MNEPFDSTERRQPTSSGGDSSASIERQLRAFQPRAPRLNWEEIHSASKPAATATLPSSETSSRAGYSLQQLALAIAASWILGALIGGGSMFWSMSSPVSSRVTSPGQSPDHRSLPQEHVASDAELKPATGETSARLAPVEYPAAFDAGMLAWKLDEPLSVRSLSNSPGRFTSTRTSKASRSINANTATESATSFQDSTFPPEPVLNRQQLMREFFLEQLY